MNLLYSVLLSCFALCAATTIDATSVDWSRNWQLYPRNHPRRPPPPLDLPRVHHRLPVFRPISTANPDSTTTTPPVVLYKHNCDPCWPGWGVKSLCNSTSNTVCKQCPMGTWSPRHFHYRECEPCAKCGRGLYEELPCTTTRDTKCDSCSNAKAKFTEDFMKKCEWRELAGTMDPRELDLDDTRIDIQAFDYKPKEAPDVKPDSQEFGSNEEDIDRHLQAEQEEDITVDDPEIDVDQPQEKKEDEKDVSKEQEEEWARIMEARRGARHQIAELSKRLEEQGRQAQQEQEDDDDDEDDVGLEIGRRILHPIRPLPQTMPGPERTIHVEPEDDIVRPNEPPVENNYPPSYHTYPIDTLSHAGDTQRRKAIVLLVLTCAIVLSTIAFVACYVREYCRRRVSSYNRVLVVNLTPEEREIVRQSAQALETMENPKKKYRSDHGYSAIANQDPEACVCVTENPLEAYLNATDERHLAKESLVENEVLDDHYVHRR